MNLVMVASDAVGKAICINCLVMTTIKYPRKKEGGVASPYLGRVKIFLLVDVEYRIHSNTFQMQLERNIVQHIIQGFLVQTSFILR